MKLLRLGNIGSGKTKLSKHRNSMINNKNKPNKEYLSTNSSLIIDCLFII